MKKKILATVMALAMALTLLPVTALADEGDDLSALAEEGDAYTALKEAVEAAPANGARTTVTLTGDITGLTTDEILTIEE